MPRKRPEPKPRRRYHVGNSEHLMVREIVERSGASDATIRYRIEKGIRGPELVAPPLTCGRPKRM